MNDCPLVTVSIACYNGGELVELAIQSILNQSYPHIELLLIDDGSEDQSKEILTRYSTKPNTRLIRLDSNMGLRNARQIAIKEAMGKYLFYQDADDVSHESRISRQVELLEEHPEFVVCGTGSNYIDEQGLVTVQFLAESSPEKLRASFFFCMPMMSPTMAFRTMALRHPQSQVPAQVVQAEDYVLLALLLPLGCMGNIVDPLYNYRVHKNPNRITDDRNNTDIVQGRKIAWRIMLQYLQLQTSDEVLEVHDKITYYRNRITKANVSHFSGYLQLLTNMKNANRHLGIFEKKAFESGVANRMYSTLLHNALTMTKAIALGWKFRDSLGYTTLMKLSANRIRRLVLQIED